MVNLSTKYLGLKIDNPLIVASSGLTSSADSIQKCEEAGAGAVVLKSIFEEQIDMEVNKLERQSDSSNWHPEAAQYISQYGKENAFQTYLSTLKEAKKRVSIPLIASVHCVSAGSWIKYASRLEAAGADAIELNLFVMPSDTGNTAADNESIYFDIIRKVKEQISIPLSIKTGYYFSNLAFTLVKFSKTELDGLVLFNRFYSPDFNINTMKVVPSNPMSHPGEYIHPLRWISILSGKMECDLAATTGIHDGETVIKLMLAGAAAVQLCSTLYKNGIEKISEIKSTLETWMEKNNYSDLDMFRGTMNQEHIDNPAEFDRVQFMKTTIER